MDSSVGLRVRTAPPSAPDGPDARARTRARRLRQELVVRAGIAALLFVFDVLLGTGGSLVRVIAVAAFLLNAAYYLAARAGRALRLQAWVRLSVDIVFITVGLYGAGGLHAAPYLGVYALVPVYVGLVFSSIACLAATILATVAFLTVAGLQHLGWLPVPHAATPEVWSVAAFNLLILNIVGGLTAILAEAYRQSRRRLAALNEELRRANDAAQRLNAEIQRAGRLRVLGEVVAGVTHEISNVLTVAHGHVGLAEKKAEGRAPEAMVHLRHAQEACQTAMRIVRNALETSRQSTEETVAICIPEVVRRVVELKAYDLRRARISVHVGFPDRFPSVRGAPFQLQQVLLNLVTNAQHALHDRPGRRAIAITGLAAADRVVVQVQDSGPGIPDELLPRLFEPFFTTKAEGTGLGLAISAAIVKELDGELTAANHAGGAVFRIDLPALRDEVAAGSFTDEPTSVAAGEPGRGGGLVL